jgi:hypothetical protein
VEWLVYHNQSQLKGRHVTPLRYIIINQMKSKGRMSLHSDILSWIKVNQKVECHSTQIFLLVYENNIEGEGHSTFYWALFNKKIPRGVTCLPFNWLWFMIIYLSGVTCLPFNWRIKVNQKVECHSTQIYYHESKSIKRQTCHSTQIYYHESKSIKR